MYLPQSVVYPIPTAVHSSSPHKESLRGLTAAREIIVGQRVLTPLAVATLTLPPNLATFILMMPIGSQQTDTNCRGQLLAPHLARLKRAE